MTILLQSSSRVILRVEKLILFLDNPLLIRSLPFLIYVLKGYPVQERYFGYSYHIFYLLFLKSQQTVFLSSFYSIVHVSYHLCNQKHQIHLAVHLFFESSQPLPVLMTTMYHHVLAVIGPFSSAYSNTESDDILY